MEKMKNEYPVAAMAEALEVSKSGFFAHRRKGTGQRRRQDRRLSAHIAPIFVEHWRRYGSPRMTKALRERGHRCGKNRVARLMREAGLCPKQKHLILPRFCGPAGVLQKEHYRYGNITEQVWQEI